MGKLRNWTDWVDVDKNSYMTPGILNLFHSNFVETTILVKDTYNIYIPIEEFPTANEYTVPTVDYINIIEKNLKNLYKRVGFIKHEEPREWQGNYSDKPLLSYKDVNRWFNSLTDIKNVVENSAPVYLISGTFTAGNDFNRQFLNLGGSM